MEGRWEAGQINAMNPEDRAGSVWIASHKGQNQATSDLSPQAGLEIWELRRGRVP